MRILVLLAFVLSVACATRVPPITSAENWEQFNQEGGCFNDLYLYDENTDMDAAIHYRTVVTIVGDFSYPYDDADADFYEEAYNSEFTTLLTFMNELSEQAFPVSVFEDYSTATGYDFYSSLRVMYMSYFSVNDHYSMSEKWYYLNHPEDNCLQELINTGLYAAYSEFLNAMATDDSILFDYQEQDYLNGIAGKLALAEMCQPNEMCYILLTRVNPAMFDINHSVTYVDINGNTVISPMYEVYNSLRAKGYTIITLDAATSRNFAQATEVASIPYSRYQHMLSKTSFPEPQMAATKLVQAIRGGESACYSYGAHQIVTYDGYGYNHNYVGDFVLAKDLWGGSFEVQVRNEQCQIFGMDGVVCTTGLAVRIGSRTIAFYYDNVDDLLAVTVDGELIKPGYIVYDEFVAYAIHKNPCGYEVAVSVSESSPYIPPFTFIRAEFSLTGNVAVYPAPSLRYGLGGLCGTFDGCALDEYYMANELFTDDVAVFSNSWMVHGGTSIFEQSKFTSDELPFVRHQPLLPYSWVPWTPLPGDVRQGHIDSCSNYGSGPIFDACVYANVLQDKFSYDQVNSFIEKYPHNYGISDFLVWNPISMVCADMCDGEYSRIGGMNMMYYNCSTICDQQFNALNDPALTFSFPDYFTEQYKLKIPVATANYGRDAFFMAPLGGDYLVRVRSTDCCTESPNLEFYVSVNCQTDVYVTVTSDTDAITVSIDEFALPLVELEAALENADGFNDGSVHVMWEFVSIPPKSTTPELYNQFTLWPTFVPQAKGDYVLQVLATNGCSVSADIIVVHVECYLRDYGLSTLDSDSMIFKPSDDWMDSYFAETRLTLDSSCLAPIGSTTASEFGEFPWTFTPVSWVIDFERQGEYSDVLQIVSMTPEDLEDMGITIPDMGGNSYAAYVVFWDIDEYIPGAEYDFENHTIDDEAGAWEDWPVVIPQRDPLGPHEYGIIRGEARIEVSERQVLKDTTLSGWYRNKNSLTSIECFIFTEVDFVPQADGTFKSQLTITAMNAYHELFAAGEDDVTSFAFGTYDVQETGNYDWLEAYPDEWEIAVDNFWFRTGHCPGTYKVTVDLIDDFACEPGHDEYMMDLTCVRRPMPLPILPCFDIYFHYDSDWTPIDDSYYPTAQLLGYDSTVAAYRDMDFRWFLKYEGVTSDAWDYFEWTSATTFDLYDPWYPNVYVTYDAPPYLDMQFDRGADLKIPYMSAPDTYTARLYMTDHCMNNYDEVEVNFVCREYPVADVRIDTSSPAQTLVMPVTNPVILTGNHSTIPAYTWGARRTLFAPECIEPQEVKDWRHIFGTAFAADPASPMGCFAYADSAFDLDTDALFDVTANMRTISGNYEVQLGAFDQCTYSIDSVLLTATCATDHPAWTLRVSNDLDSTVISDGGLITVTYDVQNTEWPALTLTATPSPATNALATDNYRWFLGLTNDTFDYADPDSATDTITVTPQVSPVDTTARYPFALAAWDHCNYGNMVGYVRYQCATTPAMPAAPTWSVGVTTTWSTGNLNKVYSYNASTGGYTVTLTRPGTDYSDSWLTCDLEIEYDDSLGCAISTASNPCAASIQIDFSADCNDVDTEVLFHYSLTDGCRTVHSTDAHLDMVCHYIFQVTPVGPGTVTWLNGEFPVACLSVPDGQANFYWTKPWEEGQNNWQTAPEIMHTWYFTGNTPELSVFQTKNWNYTVLTPGHPTYGYDYAKTSKTEFEWYAWNDDAFGLGYVMDYMYEETVSVTTQVESMTYLWPEYGVYNGHGLFLDNSVLGGCFRPDVPGTYTLMLDVTDGCTQLYPTIDVIAECGPEPVVTVDTPAVGDAQLGSRYAFVATATDENDFMLTYEWSLYYCGNPSGLVDVTDYVTNAHALDASFIPIYQGCHHYYLTVSDGCNDPVVVEDEFEVGCISGVNLPDPLAPLDDEGHEVIWTVIDDWDGTGMLPLTEMVANLQSDQVLFNWKVIGFTPRFSTWEEAFPASSVAPGPNPSQEDNKDVIQGANTSSFTTPLLTLATLFVAILVFF